MPERPLYMDVYDDLFLKIKTAEYKENSLLPPERELCDFYHVSRSTVRSALYKLQKNGLVYTVHGSGTYVKAQLIEQQLLKFYSFTDELKNRGTDFGCAIINYEVINASEQLGNIMGCHKGAAVHVLVRLRCSASVPLMLETTYLPKSRFNKINPAVLPNSSLYEYLRARYNMHMDQAVETFQPILPSARERELLGISHTMPCMLLERFGYEDGALVEYTRSVVRGDKYIFKVMLDNKANEQATGTRNT